tara:strand:+ start:137499 stop:142409 length:4911 start_codon:yes stop_codon:yes gene_type:complete
MKHLKIISPLLFLLLINNQLFSQFNHIGFQVPDSIFNDHPFQQMDTSSLLSSAVLWDRINPNFDFESFQGFNDAEASNSQIFNQSYIDIHSAFINPLPLNYDQFLEEYENQVLAHNALPIASYSIEYQKIKSHALDSALISIVDSQFVIGPNKSENPMNTQYLWQISSVADLVPNQEVFRVVFPEVLSINNLSPSENFTQMSVDFDDGLGYRTVFWDSIIDVQYNDEPGTEKLVKVKFSNPSGSNSFAFLKWKTTSTNSCQPPLDDAPWPGHIMTYPYTTIINNQIHVNQSTTLSVNNLIEASIPYKGEKALGKAYIKYRNSAPANNTQFDKPMIFVEGIDFSPPFSKFNSNSQTQFNPYQDSECLGDVGWPTLWGCDSKYPFQKAPAYLDSLLNEGYDIIMLDFWDGADYIQRNAFLLIELINRINQNKIGEEQIVILGASMGGQVTRWALNYMEENEMDHCVRLFCSFDSPWKGAHIPLALQSFLKYMAEDGNKSLAQGRLKDLRRPASKQLILYHIDECDDHFSTKSLFGTKKWNVSYNFPNLQTFATHSLFDQFYQENIDMGDFPKNCRNVAIANGNNLGLRDFSNGQQYINYDQSCFGFKNKAKLYAEGAGNNIISELNTAIPFKEVWEKRYKTFNTHKLDNSPGGYRSDFSEVKASLIAALANYGCYHNPSLIRSNATFIPVVSALALSNNDWDYKLKGQVGEYSCFKSGITHFEGYIAATNNEEHVEVSDENMSWFLDQVRKGEKKLENHNGGILVKTWNNPLENKHIGGLEINSGGSLYINANRPIYDEAPKPYAKNFPPQGGIAKVIIGNPCNSNNTVNINNGGKLILGDNNIQNIDGNNQAEVHIAKGAIVNVNNGGHIFIHEGSKLIIDKGAKLSIKAGASIELLSFGNIIVEDGGELEYFKDADFGLLDNDANIHIKGKLVVRSNATFTFRGQGKLILDQKIPWLLDNKGNPYLDLANYMQIDSGAKFKLMGNSPMDKSKTLMECRRPFYFKDGSGGIFEEVDILNGAIKLNNGALLFSFGKTFISNATISSGDSQKHGGFRIWNNGSYNLIRNTDIKNGNLGVFAQGFTGANSLNFNNCKFINNKTGLKINGGSFNCSNVDFYNNILDIKAEALSGESIIRYSDFDNSGLGITNKSILVTGQQGSLLGLDNCVFKNHSTFIRAVGIDLRADCSEFNNSDVAINLEDGILYINEDAGNIFKQNVSQSILLTGNTSNSGIFLKDGQNIFEKDNNMYNRYFRHIDGYFPGGFPQSDFMPNNIDIDADNNSFDLYNPFNHPENFFFFLSYNGNIPTYHDIIINNNLSNADCNSPSTLSDVHPLGPVVMQFPGSGGKVHINGNSEPSDLKLAALEAIDHLSIVEEERNDLEALNQFLDILESPISQADASSSGILHACYKGAFNALNNAYQYEKLIRPTGNQLGQPQELSNLISMIQSKINLLNPLTDSNDMPSNFQFHLDMVHSYRVAGFYSDALTELGNYNNWTYTYEQQQRSGYWSCVCRAENDYQQGDIKEEGFIYEMEQCQQSFAGYNYKRQVRNPERKLSQNQVFDYHPQPVIDQLSLFVEPEISGLVKLRITDLSGKEILKEEFMWLGNRHEINLSFLKPGLYFLLLESKDVSKKIRILKS